LAALNLAIAKADFHADCHSNYVFVHPFSGSHIKLLQLWPAELFWQVLSAYTSREKMRCDLHRHN